MNESQLSEIASIFRQINQAIWVVTTRFDEKNSGLTATWLHQASIDANHPTILIGLAPNHFTCGQLIKSGRCVIHLLKPDQTEIAWGFSRPSSRHLDKFAGLATEEFGEESSSRIPRLSNCHSALACRTIEKFDAGDRIYFLSRIEELIQTSSGPFLRESDFFAACTEAQKNQLKDDLDKDVQTQRPLLKEWLERRLD